MAQESIRVPDSQDDHLLKILKKPGQIKSLTRVNQFSKRHVRGENSPHSGRKYSGDNREGSREEYLLQAAEVGNAPAVRSLLRMDQDLDVDCQDIMGRTALTLAVTNEHLEVVELLLDRSSHFNVYEALLISIQLGHDDIAETILRSPKYDEIQRHQQLVGRQNFFLTPMARQSKFSAEVTPIVLAAQRNRFEIALLLLQRGEKIEKPHKYNCVCGDCKGKQSLDDLKFAKWRLNTYKGLASEAYISLSSKDPILTAFELSQELKELAHCEKHFRNEYNAMAEKLCDYVVKLLDQVRGNDELDVILNEQKGLVIWGESPDRLARLDLALKYEQRGFVAHPSCQKKLATVWYGDWQTFDHISFLLKPLFAILFILVYPVLAILYLFLPFSKVGNFLRIPFVKFLASTLSFIVFVILVTVYVLYENSNLGKYQEAKKFPVFYAFAIEYKSNLTGVYAQMADFKFRQGTLGRLQIVIGIWILGLLWQEVKQLYREGAAAYFTSAYNFIDVCMLACYLASFTLQFVSFVKVHNALRYFERKEGWDALVKGDANANASVYWLNSDRFYWQAEDPINLAEGTFSVANVLTFSRLTFLLTASEHLGPLQISLSKMAKDIMKFMSIWTLVLLAFMIGIYNLYWYYNPDVRRNLEIGDHGIETNAEQNFGTIELTFRTVYWALFGMGEKTDVELGDQYAKGFTERLGYLIFGFYNWVMCLVLLNMLIAMMTMSFEHIASNQDTEWKFARSELYMEYIREGSTLPPPFNIIPSPKSFVYLFRPCYRRCKKRGTTKEYELDPTSNEEPPLGMENRAVTVEESTSSPGGSSPVEGGADFPHDYPPVKRYKKSLAPALKYQDVIKSVVKRYIYYDCQGSDDGGEAELDDIKQDISSFRYEILNRLSAMEDSLQKSVNYVSAKVDLISGGVFEETMHNASRQTNAAEPKMRPKSSAESSQGVGLEPFSPTSDYGSTLGSKAKEPRSILDDYEISPDDVRYERPLIGREYSPADLNRLVSLMNSLPQETVDNIPLEVQLSVAEDPNPRAKSPLPKKRKGKKKEKFKIQDEKNNNMSEC